MSVLRQECRNRRIINAVSNAAIRPSQHAADGRPHEDALIEQESTTGSWQACLDFPASAHGPHSTATASMHYRLVSTGRSTECWPSRLTRLVWA